MAEAEFILFCVLKMSSSTYVPKGPHRHPPVPAQTVSIASAHAPDNQMYACFENKHTFGYLGYHVVRGDTPLLTFI